MSTSAGAGAAAVLYWALVVALVGFGAIGIFSVGPPFLVLGFVLASIYPLRRRVEAFWPPIVAVIAFFAGWWLLGPVSCVTVAHPVEVRLEEASPAPPVPGPTIEDRTTCTSALGISYAGDPYWLGPLAGVVSAAALGGGSYFGLRRAISRRR